jgi:hypothetical protein
MRVIEQPACHSNLGERLVGRSHHRACTLDAPPGDVVKRSDTDADLERSK